MKGDSSLPPLINLVELDLRELWCPDHYPEYDLDDPDPEGAALALSVAFFEMDNTPEGRETLWRLNDTIKAVASGYLRGPRPYGEAEALDLDSIDLGTGEVNQ